jgi:glyoxylase I family protein
LLTRGYGHIAFETSDLDADYAGMVARGARPVWDPRPSPEPGIRMAFVADTDGNLVELVEAGAAQFAQDVNTGR